MLFLDLKIENILISQSGDVKIIDFGLSNTYSNENLLKTFCGSLYFAAPELLSARPYHGPEIDVWSFGVVIYVLVTGRVPFDDKSMPALHSKIKRGYVEYPSWLSSDCKDLLSKMLVVDPSQRASLDDVKRHPWMIKGYDNKPPESMVPFRKPITLPLDPSIIMEMSGFEFGSPEKIMNDMKEIIQSPKYVEACNNWYKHQGVNIQGLDPTNAYHPLLSIYYLVQERQDRMNIKRHSRTSSTQVQHAQPKHEAAKLQRNSSISEKFTPPVISVPEAAHAVGGPVSPLLNSTAGPSAPGAVPATTVLPPEINAPKTRARARTQGPTEFVFGDPPSSIESNSSGSAGGGGHSREPSTGGLGIATSLFRRFSSKRRSGRDVSSPTTSTTPITMSNSVSAQQRRLSKHQQHYSQPVNSYVMDEPPASAPLEQKFPRKPVQSQELSRSVSSKQTKFAENTKFESPSNSTVTSEKKRYHPSARAKSLGHVVKREDPGSSDITDEYYNDYSRPTSTTSTATKSHSRKNSLQQAETLSIGAMPSIEYPKQVFLKGFFSVQSTSTRSLPFIRSDVIRVLNELKIDYKEIKGGFTCVYRTSSTNLQFSNNAGLGVPEQQQSKGHWRKLSFGSGVFGSSRKTEEYSDFSTDSVMHHPQSNGDNQLGSTSNNTHSPLLFEIWIVKIPLLSLHGVQFKKLSGNSWVYKSLASKILSNLKL